MKWLFEHLSEIPTILRTLGCLDFGSVRSNNLREPDEVDEPTGISLKRPHSHSNPNGF